MSTGWAPPPKKGHCLACGRDLVQAYDPLQTYHPAATYNGTDNRCPALIPYNVNGTDFYTLDVPHGFFVEAVD